MTKSRTLKNDVVPGWHLVQATKTYENWKAGEYALLRCNDPDFIFTIPITKELPQGKGRGKKSISKVWWDYHEQCQEFSSQLQGSIEAGHDLYNACVKAGYRNQSKDGFIAYWLRKHMAKKLNRK